MVATLVTVALCLPVAALGSTKDSKKGSYVAPGLLAKAKDHPKQKIRVIIQSDAGVNGASGAITALGNSGSGNGQFGLRKQLPLVGAVSLELPAALVEKLSQMPGLTITPDSPVKVSGNIHYSTQLWPYESGNAQTWYDSSSSATPTIAIVDSGLDASKSDFAGRAYPQVNLSTLTPNATGDDRGHGTFVAGIAAGDALGKTGANPSAKILPIRVMDGNGMAMTSDVIRAAQFILDNKAKYNIKVANFSLHSAMPSQFTNDPLDRAVEKLWFNGIVVVAAAGNYGSTAGPSGVKYAPGNDPFVITVGAVDLGGSIRPSDDFPAPWSAYGYTYDGFAKPDLAAPGRFMIGPVPAGSSLATERADHVVSPGYMQLSGTSFSAPAVSGAAAAILARHPLWTPDQVKGALMVTAKPVPNAAPLSVGVGELNAGKAAGLRATPVANKALNRFLVTDPLSGGVTFDAASWASTAKANASWADASWADASWAEASWSSASWADASWAEASWADGALAAASWADASWAEASWADMSSEDAAEGDATADPVAVTLDTVDTGELTSDPDIAVPAEALPPGDLSATDLLTL
ncbi:MAG: serine protease AprX [Gaiellaceae bacterium]|jgi:serine protease AprX|nr:serine protease AprX [Gaiellaceae bacterium]